MKFAISSIHQLTTDELWEMICEIARVYSYRKYRDVATGLTLHMRAGSHVEPIPFQVPALPAPRIPDESSTRPAGGWASGSCPKHTSNFSSIYWPSLGVFHFVGDKQRAVARRLWQAWEEGEEHVEQAELMATAESDGNRLHNLFRARGNDHPSWRTLILKGNVPGTYTFPINPAFGDAEEDASERNGMQEDSDE